MKANYFNFARPQELFVLFACLGWPWDQHEAQIFNAKRKVKRSFGGSHLRRVMSGVCWLRMLPLNSCSHSSHGSSRKMCSSLGGVIRDARSWAVSYIKSSKHTGKCRWKNKNEFEPISWRFGHLKSPILEYPEFALCARTTSSVFHIQLNRRLQAEDVFINIDGVRFWRPYPGGQILMPLQSSCIYGG